MTEITAILQQHNIEKEEITKLLTEDKKLTAIKLVAEKTGLAIIPAKNLLESIALDENYFENSAATPLISVKMTNTNGYIKVRLKINKQKEKVVYPTDPYWIFVRKALGHRPALLEYEKQFKENPVRFLRKPNSSVPREALLEMMKIVVQPLIITLLIFFVIIKVFK